MHPDTTRVGIWQWQGLTLAVTVGFFSSPAQEVLLHQDGLKQLVINNHVLRREIRRQREVRGWGENHHGEAEPATLSPRPQRGFCASWWCVGLSASTGASEL